MQVITPCVPGMSTRSRIELVLDAFCIEEFQGGQPILVSDILRIALGEDKLTHVLLNTIGGLDETLVVALELLFLGREPTSTQHPEIVELVVVVEDGLHRLHASH